MQREIRDLLIIQSLNLFIVGIIEIVLPLFLKERGISIEIIGIIFALTPIIFQFTRMLFAVLSDFFGRRIFFILNSFMNLFYLLAYYVSVYPIGFLIGKILEGIKNASLYGVNRAYVMDHSKEKKKHLIYLRSLSNILRAFGNFFAGFLIILLSYANTILFCMCLSLLLPFFVIRLKEKRKKKFKWIEALREIDIRKMKISLKIFLLLFFVRGLSIGFISGYVLPLFLRNIGMEVRLIGIILSTYLLLSGFSSYLFRGIEIKKLVLFGGFFSSLFLMSLSFLYPLVPFIILLLGWVKGIEFSSVESLISKISRKESYAADIGMLFLGFHIGLFISQFLAGFIIASFGFNMIFTLSALILIIYTIFAYRTLRFI